MFLGALLLAAPVLVPVLIWWWRGRHKKRRGKSLPIFLLGYVMPLTLNGLTDLADQWSRPKEVGDYVAFVFAATVAGYLLGGLGWMILAAVREPLLDALSRWLAIPSDLDANAQ